MKEYFLEELLQIKNGRDHKHLSEGNIPVFGSGGIMRYGNQAIYNDESILLPRKGSLTNIQFVNKPFWTVDTIYYTVINKEKANPLYLYHYLKQLDLSYLNSGTGVPSMTFGAYYQVKVNLPSLDIQKKIAKVLSDLEAKIEVNNRINNELEAIAKTLYDYWFVQFDFPDSNGKPYKNSGGKMVWNEELKREIPENWKVKIVDDLLAKELTTTKIPSSEILEEGLIPVVDQSTNYIKGFTNDKTALIKAEKARIVFGDHTRILKLINFDFARGADGTQVLLSNNEKMPQHLFYHCLLKIDLSNYGYARHFKFLKDSTIIVPSKKIAIQFEKLVSSFYGKIKANIFQNQELASLRDWLLPMLMNGQVTVGGYEVEDDNELGMVAESSGNYQLNLTDKEKKIRRKMLATYIINQSLNDISFGKTKFEKLLHLIECHIVKGDYNQRYSIQAAGPYDGGFTKVFWNEVTKAKWFKIVEFGMLKRIMPAENHSKSLADYGYLSDDLKLMINDFIGEFKNTNYERPEIVSTLYAVWNNRIIRNEIITDELLKKDFLEWDTQKARYKDRLDKALEWMRENAIIPDGWGNEIRRAKK
ncbi:Restriction endonuclease S subunit [Flavobacterium flevense]|uniref:Type I restriction modification DNA specificity domain-containing protein n=1 Tax=Flavobacterium flevense TaxID=983 RepID=A0A4Y4B191_9FLAO|nr:restriction endonuclease subunit S [Flavobacterium flevense]GEC73020.1 hypothetical protein FFL01_25590 [Flavobacterium flevense]SHM18973.1 Restriction endonuclease S subunit [Flavobacterium flevense]